MEPASFEQENTILHTPEGMSPDTIPPLYAHVGPDTAGNLVTITCWKITKEEMEQLQRTGRVWLIVLGDWVPPVRVTAKNPFEEREEKP